MKPSKPTLSVVIPTYNRCDSLRVTLEALARQEAVPGGFEAIVVSDGSTDGTTALLQAWAARDLPFTLHPILQENAGPARARNRGIGAAIGEIVVFLDDDVEPQPECLRRHAERHAGEDRLVLIGPMSPDPDRRPREAVWIAWEHAMLQKQYDAWASGLWPDNAGGPHNFYTGNASVRRAHLTAVGGFDEGFVRQEDVELAMRMERECQVFFRFDPTLRALHRPLRTFESWLRVPFAYGKLDVVRARRGDAPWDVVQRSYTTRHVATRTVASVALRDPGIGAGLRRVLRGLAELLYDLPAGAARRAGLSALSALYNIHYLEGARDELGGWDALRRVLNEAPPPGSTEVSPVS